MTYKRDDKNDSRVKNAQPSNVDTTDRKSAGNSYQLSSQLNSELNMELNSQLNIELNNKADAENLTPENPKMSNQKTDSSLANGSDSSSPEVSGPNANDLKSDALDSSSQLTDSSSQYPQRPDILDLTLDELKSEMAALGEKPFRADQVYKWLYKGAASFEEMTDLSKALIQKLDGHFAIGTLQQLRRLVSSDNHTIKYLYLLSDNNIIECVAMKYHHGVTLCLSTQVGCAMGCSFCASTTGGLIRSLTAGEMMAQVLSVNRDLTAEGKEQIGGLVLMGSGEPLDNYANTLKFMQQIHDPKGFNMGYRSITLSTCGLVPKMRALADEGLSINLAISLHAPNDAIRKEIMKIANAYSIKDVIDASKYYFEKTGRRITFEYALIKGINDQPEHARELSTLLKGFPCHINLIPLNENEHSSQKRSNEDSIKRFTTVLESAGMNVTRRREMGLDIQGACGQLKAAYIKNETVKKENAKNETVTKKSAKKEKGGHKGV